MIVASVLRSGGDFSHRWVEALRVGVERNIPGTRFVCISDVDVPAECIPLRHPWPGWWSKMAMFEPGLFDDLVLYLDLDTLVVGDASFLARYVGDFAMLRDWYPPHVTRAPVLMFRPGLHTDALWADWVRAPDRHMADYRDDGYFIRERAAHDDLADVFPGAFASFKRERRGLLQVRPKKPEAPVVCGHGQPRFSSPLALWAHTIWRGQRLA